MSDTPQQANYQRFLTFLAESDGMYSWGRVAGLISLFTSCGCLLYVVLKTHQIPDVATLGGLAAFAIAPFASSKGIAALAKPSAGQ